MQIKFHLPVCCLVPQRVSGQLESLKLHGSHQLKLLLENSACAMSTSLLCYTKTQETMNIKNLSATSPKSQAAGSHGKGIG